MEVIRPNGVIKVCSSCGSILDFNGDDVVVEKRSYLFTHRYIICPICKNKIDL